MDLENAQHRNRKWNYLYNCWQSQYLKEVPVINKNYIGNIHRMVAERVKSVATMEKKNLFSVLFIEKEHQNQVYFSKASNYGKFWACPKILTNHILSYSNKSYRRWLQDSWSLVGEEYSHYIHCRYGFLAPFDLHPPGIIDFGLAKLIYGLWNYDHRFLNILASLLLFRYRNNNSLKEDISKKK